MLWLLLVAAWLELEVKGELEELAEEDEEVSSGEVLCVGAELELVWLPLLLVLDQMSMEPLSKNHLGTGLAVVTADLGLQA